MEPWLITTLLFSFLLVGIALGLPIAFVLSGIAVIFTFFLWGPQGFLMIALTAYDKGTDFILVALPLFILMGNLLEVSGLADSLYEMMYRWIGRLPGGLASGTVIICAIFAAMAGISGAATVSMGLIAIPSMLRRNYHKRMVLGTVAAGGALGILIPPSIIAIIYAALAGVSVSQLFAACMIPGIILALMFIVYLTARCILQPRMGPPTEERYTWAQKFASLRAVIFPVILIILVLGGIYLGVTTPTEAAGVGAFGSIIACALHRRLSWENIRIAVSRSFSISAMIMWIVFGSFCFSRTYSVAGASELMTNLVIGLDIPPMGVIWAMMVVFFVLGMFIETSGICLITIPIFLPIIVALGFDPIWFGVLFTVNAEMDLISPPFGITLFWLKGVVPKDITMGDIYRSVWPFVAIQWVCLILIMYVPQLALWLPSLLTTVK
jgi:tripartite ATP-independent transporter DctM subunit